MWHHYLGETLLLHIIDTLGNYKNVKIGKDILEGEHLQYVVPANCWFASEVLQENSFVLCGCTVSPGFDFKDFEMPERKILIRKFPKHIAVITKLSHS
jgi:predicted cupin superfamily sugar epimerase